MADIKKAIAVLEVNKLMSASQTEFVEVADMAIEALEKQIPIKPIEYEDKYYACKCGNVLMMKWKKYNTELNLKRDGLPYCLSCGQALNWND